MPTLNVLDAPMRYLDTGTGTPTVFPHRTSQPWRKVQRHHRPQGK